MDGIYDARLEADPSVMTCVLVSAGGDDAAARDEVSMQKCMNAVAKLCLRATIEPVEPARHLPPLPASRNSSRQQRLPLLKDQLAQQAEQQQLQAEQEQQPLLSAVGGEEARSVDIPGVVPEPGAEGGEAGGESVKPPLAPLVPPAPIAPLKPVRTSGSGVPPAPIAPLKPVRTSGSGVPPAPSAASLAAAAGPPRPSDGSGGGAAVSSRAGSASQPAGRMSVTAGSARPGAAEEGSASPPAGAGVKAGRMLSGTGAGKLRADAALPAGSPKTQQAEGPSGGPREAFREPRA